MENDDKVAPGQPTERSPLLGPIVYLPVVLVLLAAGAFLVFILVNA